jgi:catechol 2,3-dioxygenase-like lactoylglutathione lyase family enzyme
MSSTQMTAAVNRTPEVAPGDMSLEVVVVPVSDVDRAKSFYAATLGFRLHADVTGDDGFRVVQVTPPGSRCSIIFGAHVTDAVPGTAQGMILVVHDIDASAVRELHHLICKFQGSRVHDMSYTERFQKGALLWAAGRCEEARSCACRALQESPNLHPALRIAAASNALLDRKEDAQNAMARLRQIDPALRIADLETLTPVCRTEDIARYAEGLRRAGLPQ